MLLLKTIELADNERALLFKSNRFVKILVPGSYRFFDPLNKITIERYDCSQRRLQHRLEKLLAANFSQQIQQHLLVSQIGEQEVGLLYVDGQLSDIIAPGSFRLYWKAAEQIEIRIINIEEQFEVNAKLLKLLIRSPNPELARVAAQNILMFDIRDNHIGLLVRNGKLHQVLQPGSYGFWRYHRNLEICQFDLRLQNLEVSGQEILSKDKVSLRLNLSAAYRISDAVMVQQKLANINDFLYREFQLQLREAVGTSSLDELLSDKNALNTCILDGVRQRLEGYGIQVQSVGVRDIILPGDMKSILNQVVEAEKSAEANLIRRREETAATRSLYNTAKLMENNPTLMRLKELEVVEKVTERVSNLNIYSGLDGVVNGLIAKSALPSN